MFVPPRLHTNKYQYTISMVLSFLGKSKDYGPSRGPISYRRRFKTCTLFSSASPLLRKGHPVRKERWYGNKSSSFACGSHGYNSKLTGQGHPVRLHCILSIIQSSQLDFTRSEAFTWPTMDSFWLPSCPSFFSSLPCGSVCTHLCPAFLPPRFIGFVWQYLCRLHADAQD